MFSPYNGYMPYNQMPQNALQRDFSNFNMQGQQLVRVSGIDGAKAYQMCANSTVSLFDNNEDIMYIKTTDGAGFPTIRTFKFEEITKDVDIAKNANTTYITRKDMEEYVEQFIQEREERTTDRSGTSEND